LIEKGNFDAVSISGEGDDFTWVPPPHRAETGKRKFLAFSEASYEWTAIS